MFPKETYIELVKQHFNYLVEVYQFSESVVERSRVLALEYRKGELLTKIEYSYANRTIDVIIYNHISIVPPGNYSWKYSVGLAYLLKRDLKEYEFERDYKALMPSEIPLDQSIQKLAFLLNKHGAKILNGEEWISWGEIGGYSKYVPTELP